MLSSTTLQACMKSNYTPQKGKKKMKKKKNYRFSMYLSGKRSHEVGKINKTTPTEILSIHQPAVNHGGQDIQQAGKESSLIIEGGVNKA